MATDMAEMQKQLNQDVMDKPFSVARESKIDANIQNATKISSWQLRIKQDPVFRGLFFLGFVLVLKK